MLIFVTGLLLAVILLGVGTAYISKLKQQRRQLSDNSLFNCGALASKNVVPSSSTMNTEFDRQNSPALLTWTVRTSA